MQYMRFEHANRPVTYPGGTSEPFAAFGDPLELLA
jgi:hypothetical protein